MGDEDMSEHEQIDYVVDPAKEVRKPFPPSLPPSLLP